MLIKCLKFSFDRPLIYETGRRVTFKGRIGHRSGLENMNKNYKEAKTTCKKINKHFLYKLKNVSVKCLFWWIFKEVVENSSFIYIERETTSFFLKLFKEKTVRSISYGIKGFQKKYDLVTDKLTFLLTYLLTNRHKGAPLLQTFKI